MARTIKSATVASDSTGWSYWVHFTDGHGESGEAEDSADGILLASVYGASPDASDWSEERDGALRWYADADDDYADEMTLEHLEAMLHVAELADDDEGADLVRRALDGDADALEECVRSALENACLWYATRGSGVKMVVTDADRVWSPGPEASAKIAAASDPAKMAVWLCQMDPELGSWG